jgi:class 3 adenylate cyclase
MVALSIEPRIRYATTTDGVSIAYWTLGDGPPVFVSSPFVFCHAGLEGQIPLLERNYRRFASTRMLVRWDVRNYGKSQRGVAGLGPEDWASDVSAVADDLSLDRFDFVGLNFHPTIAALDPDRVRSLVLVMPSAPRLAELLDDPDQAAVRSLAASNWDIFTEAHGSFLQGWHPDLSLDLARFIRNSVDQRDYLRIMDAWRDWDVTPYLPEIRCPTLIVTSAHAAGRAGKHVTDGWLTYASQIRGSELVEIDGNPLASEEVLDLVAAFLDRESPAGDPDLGNDRSDRHHDENTDADGRFRAVMFTDIIDHTAMMTRLGDTAGRLVLREHDRITRDALRRHHGTEIKTMGDGFLASFDSVSQALNCAVALQRDFAQRTRAADEEPTEPIRIRIGVNAGEPVQEDGDLFGATVIAAARIAAIADAGEILVPEAVRHLVAGKEFAFTSRGEYVLKGFDEPCHLHEVNWREPAGRQHS